LLSPLLALADAASHTCFLSEEEEASLLLRVRVKNDVPGVTKALATITKDKKSIANILLLAYRRFPNLSFEV